MKILTVEEAIRLFEEEGDFSRIPTQRKNWDDE